MKESAFDIIVNIEEEFDTNYEKVMERIIFLDDYHSDKAKEKEIEKEKNNNNRNSYCNSNL